MVGSRVPVVRAHGQGTGMCFRLKFGAPRWQPDLFADAQIVGNPNFLSRHGITRSTSAS